MYERGRSAKAARCGPRVGRLPFAVLALLRLEVPLAVSAAAAAGLWISAADAAALPRAADRHLLPV